MRSSILMWLAPLALALSACTTALPPPQASFAGIQAVRRAELPPMRVGAFTPAPGRPERMDRAIQVRADSQPAPAGGYAKYLGDTLAAELAGAGRLDPNAEVVITGVVVETHVDSATPTASAVLGARFTVERNGSVVFDKTLRVQDHWTSDFMGAVAIPDAFNHYTGLFRKLAETLLTDPDFARAVHSP